MATTQVAICRQRTPKICRIVAGACRRDSPRASKHVVNVLAFARFFSCSPPPPSLLAPKMQWKKAINVAHTGRSAARHAIDGRNVRNRHRRRRAVCACVCITHSSSRQIEHFPCIRRASIAFFVRGVVQFRCFNPCIVVSTFYNNTPISFAKTRQQLTKRIVLHTSLFRRY